MKALVSGISGQDGSYLAELLLEKGYEVYGIYRRTYNEEFRNIQHLLDKIKLHSATLENYPSLYAVINEVKPDEVYHLAAQSYVSDSFADEFSTMSVNLDGTNYMLKACKEIVPNCKFYFAGTSEMFGNAKTSPQNEDTPMHPVSPYGISKLAAFHLCHYYRDAFKMFVCCGILFNHESPRRGRQFVTQKICQAAKNKQKVKLGNINSRRDWGYAGDFVKAMWLMLQQETPDDYVIATGETHSVQELVNLAYGMVGLNWQDYVERDPHLIRPNELTLLLGDASKARNKLNWLPQVKFKELIEMMMKNV